MQKDTMILSGTEYRDIPTITKINERFIYKGDFYGTTDRFRNWKCTGNSLL